MTDKHRRAQRIDEILGCLLILGMVIWVLYSALFSAASRAVVATHPAEVPQLEQTGADISVHHIRVISLQPSQRMGGQG